VNIQDLLRSSDIEQLAAVIEATPPPCVGADAAGTGNDGGYADEQPDADGAYRLVMLAFPRHPVDWMVKYNGPEHIDPEAMQRAVNRLIERHAALQTIETPDDCMREKMDYVGAMWQVWVACFGSDHWIWHACASAVGNSLFACWPRTIFRSPEEAKVQMKRPKEEEPVRHPDWGEQSHDGYIMYAIKEHTGSIRWPFDIALHPLFNGSDVGNAWQHALTKSRKEVEWYLYASITHAYSDGASGQALYADLIRYYNEETGKAERPAVEPAAPQPFKLLQRRLKSSLVGRVRGQNDPNNDVFHEVICEDWGKRIGYSKRVYIKPAVSQALRLASSDVLGCSVDIAWLTACMGAVFRMFPEEPCFHLCLKVGCRDGPNEQQMVGFLSEVRTFPVDVGDTETSTLLHLAQLFSGTRRHRAWRAPEPYEQGICVYINIVSAMIDSLPSGFQHMPRAAGVQKKWQGPAYAHLNLRIDQLALNDWDFRMFHHDTAWGWDWAGQYVHALGGAIWDMCMEPTAPLSLPPHRRANRGLPGVAEDKSTAIDVDDKGTASESTSLKRGHSEITPDAAVEVEAVPATLPSTAGESEVIPDTAMETEAVPSTLMEDGQTEADEPLRKRRVTRNGSGDAPVAMAVDEQVVAEPPEKAPRMGGGVEA
jgi:hypothetical protein